MLETTFIETELTASLIKLETAFKNNYNAYSEDVMSGIKTICNALKDIEDVAYINISYLYTNIVNGDKDLLVTAYTKDWYVGEVLFERRLFMGDYFSVLEEFEQALYKESKKYYGAVSKNELTKIKLDIIKILGRFMSEFMRTIFRKQESRQLIEVIPYNESLTILVGEYLDHAEKICHIDKREKNTDEIIFDIERGSDCTDAYYDGLMLDGLNGRDKAFKHTWFNNCDFSNIDFDHAQFYGTTFVDCRFKNVQFEHSLLVSTFFRQCHFEKCSFRNTNEELLLNTKMLDSILHEKTSFVACDFGTMDTRLIEFLGV